MEVQLQVYIISGVLLLLVVCNIFLVFYVVKLKRMITKNKNRLACLNCSLLIKLKRLILFLVQMVEVMLTQIQVFYQMKN